MVSRCKVTPGTYLHGSQDLWVTKDVTQASRPWEVSWEVEPSFGPIGLLLLLGLRETKQMIFLCLKGLMRDGVWEFIGWSKNLQYLNLVIRLLETEQNGQPTLGEQTYVYTSILNKNHCIAIAQAAFFFLSANFK